MTINTLSSEIYMIDKDILSYVQATEQDQWDNFVLYDNYWSYCFLFKGLRWLLSEALYLQKKTTKITATIRKLTPPLAFFIIYKIYTWVPQSIYKYHILRITQFFLRIITI